MWGLVATLLIYIFCRKPARVPVWGKLPCLLSATALLSGGLLLLRFSYEDYNASAHWITWALGPATLAFRRRILSAYLCFIRVDSPRERYSLPRPAVRRYFALPAT